MLIFNKGRISEHVYLAFAGFFPGFIITGEKTALVDAGVPPVGPELLEAIGEHLGDRPLDYILLTHSHYDHCGAIPFIRRSYPGLQVISSETAKKVLTKPEARLFMENMSKEVEDAVEFRKNHPDADISLNTDALDVDIVVKEGDFVDLGHGVRLEVFETPGHTRCSISFFLTPDRMLFAGESMGAYSGEDRVLANYLSDYTAFMESLKKVSPLPAEYLGLPHHGALSGRDNVRRYFELAFIGANEFRDAVEKMSASGADDKEIIRSLFESYYNGPAAMQPYGAFKVNLKAMIAAVRKAG